MKEHGKSELAALIAKELELAGYPRLGDLHQAANVLHRCYHTIWRAARSGALRVIRPGGSRGRMLVRRADLAAFASGCGPLPGTAAPDSVELPRRSTTPPIRKTK